MEAHITLNARETALGVWLVVFAVWVFRHASVREAFFEVVRAARTPKLLVIWLSLAPYTIRIVVVLENVGY